MRICNRRESTGRVYLYKTTNETPKPVSFGLTREK
jgi:hypothetical protein